MKFLVVVSPSCIYQPPYWNNYEAEEGGNVGQDKDWGGEFFHSEVQRDQWEDWGGKSRKMQKYLVRLYYLSHINSIHVLSLFWWLVPVFSMVYRWWSLVKNILRTSLTRIGNYVSFIRLPTLYKVPDEFSTLLNSFFLWGWGQWQYQPLGTSPLSTTLASSLIPV